MALSLSRANKKSSAAIPLASSRKHLNHLIFQKLMFLNRGFFQFSSSIIIHINQPTIFIQDWKVPNIGLSVNSDFPLLYCSQQKQELSNTVLREK